MTERRTAPASRSRGAGVIFLWVLLLGISAMSDRVRALDLSDPATRNAVAESHGEAFEAGLAAYDAGDYATAFETWLPLARQGDLAAQRNVAHMLRRGVGVARDPERAFAFYRRAAERGLVGAQLNLAAMYEAGDGVRRNDARAAQWYARAARAGDPEAQMRLAQMLIEGRGVEEDVAAARQLIEMAARAGHPAALALVAPVPDASAGDKTVPDEETTDAAPLAPLYRGTQVFGE